MQFYEFRDRPDQFKNDVQFSIMITVSNIYNYFHFGYLNVKT